MNAFDAGDRAFPHMPFFTLKGFFPYLEVANTLNLSCSMSEPETHARASSAFVVKFA